MLAKCPLNTSRVGSSACGGRAGRTAPNTCTPRSALKRGWLPSRHIDRREMPVSYCAMVPIPHPSPTPDMSVPRHTRLVGLDGLRGVAAAVVVLYHAVLASSIGDDYLDATLGVIVPSGIAATLADTPLRYFTMGPQSVVIFFVLSGFVLTLPMLRGKGLDLWAYYPRRALRLWVPAAASVVLAIGLIMLSRPSADDAVSDWGRRYSFETVTPRDVIGSLMFITNTPRLNNPMWSLKWEMLFSLFLPVAFLLTLRLKRGFGLAVIACGLGSALGAAWGVPSLRYAPMFLVGCVIAKMVADRGAPARAWYSWALVGGGFLLVGLPDLLRVLFEQSPGTYAQGSVTIGAAMLVLGLVVRSKVTSLFSSAPLRLLGRISFGVYLVHVPILMSAQHLVPDYPNRALLVGIPIAFFVGWLFTKYVEEPSARLARRVGKQASARRMQLV